jgi:hypothetical protein
MQLDELLRQMGGVQSVARELGVSEAQASSGAAALLPAILGGFKRQAAAPSGGLAGLAGMLGQLGGAGLLDDVLGPQPTNVSRGNDVLGQIFGSMEVSRAVAQNAAGQTGLDPTLLKKMLPMLAMMAAGFLSKQGLGGASPARQAPQGGLGGLLGGLAGGGRGGAPGGGLGGLLDLDGDGNPLDDILGMVGKLGR